MSEQNPVLQAVKSIGNNDFVKAQDFVQNALYAKAQALVDVKKQETSKNLMQREIDNEQTTFSGEG